MQDDFSITVPYKGRDIQFNVNVLLTGYTYKFLVNVNDIHIILEKDEEGNYRAIKAQPLERNEKEVDIELLVAIQKKIEKAFE